MYVFLDNWSIVLTESNYYAPIAQQGGTLSCVCFLSRISLLTVSFLVVLHFIYIYSCGIHVCVSVFCCGAYISCLPSFHTEFPRMKVKILFMMDLVRNKQFFFFVLKVDTTVKNVLKRLLFLLFYMYVQTISISSLSVSLYFVCASI